MKADQQQKSSAQLGKNGPAKNYFTIIYKFFLINISNSFSPLLYMPVRVEFAGYVVGFLGPTLSHRPFQSARVEGYRDVASSRTVRVICFMGIAKFEVYLQGGARGGRF